MARVDLFARPIVRSDTFVETIEIPPFLPDQRPDVLVWGVRFFVKAQEVSPLNTDHPAYIEAFGYVVA